MDNNNNNGNQFTCCHCHRMYFNNLNDFHDHNVAAHAYYHDECNLCHNVFDADLQAHTQQHLQPPPPAPAPAPAPQLQPPPPPPAPAPAPQQQQEAAHPQVLEAPWGADISALPAECIEYIFSFTSPKDACRACAVSSKFRAAAESNVVWERFLPSDCQAIIARSSSPDILNLSSKKKIYLSLSDNPILIDDSKKSFFLDKSSGKKCYLLPSREMSIVWGDTPQYWSWISLPEESRFPQVAELDHVWWFDISGKMSTSILSPKTRYAAYLVYKLRSGAHGFDGPPFTASVGTVGDEVYEQTVQLGLFDTDTSRPKQREDGWLEIELGQFFNGGGEADELQIKLMEVEALNKKTGLVVEGIEIRPTKGAGQDQ